MVNVMIQVKKEQIRKILSPEDLLTHLGIKNMSKSRGEIRCGCPIHNGSGDNFSYDLNSGVWTCWSHNCGGSFGVPRDEILLIQLVKNLTFIQALKYLGGLVGIPVSEDDEFDKETHDSYLVSKWLRERRKQLERRKNNPIDVGVLKAFKCGAEHPYPISRGFDKDVISEFEIGFANSPLDTKEADRAKGMVYPGRMIVPIRDEENSLVGFSGRLATNDTNILDALGKYRNAVDFQKGACLYNLNRAKNFMESEYPIPNSLVLVEGFMDVIRAAQFSGFNFVATMGTIILPEQLDLIIKHTSTVVLAYDEDKAGREATTKIYKQLKNYCDVYVLKVPEKDVGAVSFDQFWEMYTSPQKYRSR